MIKVVLRDLNPKTDLALFHEAHSDRNSMKYYGMLPCQSITESQELMSSYIRSMEECKSIHKVICDMETGEYMGEKGLFNINAKHKRAESYSILLPKHRGKGVSGIVSGIFSKTIYSTTDFNRIEAMADARNLSAANSLRRIGYRYEGRLRGYEWSVDGYNDMDVFSKTREDFLTDNANSATLDDISCFEGRGFKELLDNECADCPQKVICDAPYESLDTERILLRKHSEDDKESYFRMMANSNVVRYYGRSPMMSREDVEHDYSKMNYLHNIGNTTRYAVIEKKIHEYVGTVGIRYDNKNKKGTLSCVIDQPYWNRGIASEAISTLANYMFVENKYHRLQVLVDPRNKRALNFFDKMGFAKEATLRQYEFENNNFIDLIIMSKISSE